MSDILHELAEALQASLTNLNLGRRNFPKPEAAEYFEDAEKELQRAGVALRRLLADYSVSERKS